MLLDFLSLERLTVTMIGNRYGQCRPTVQKDVCRDTSENSGWSGEMGNRNYCPADSRSKCKPGIPGRSALLAAVALGFPIVLPQCSQGYIMSAQCTLRFRRPIGPRFLGAERRELPVFSAGGLVPPVSEETTHQCVAVVSRYPKLFAHKSWPGGAISSLAGPKGSG